MNGYFKRLPSHPGFALGILLTIVAMIACAGNRSLSPLEGIIAGLLLAAAIIWLPILITNRGSEKTQAQSDALEPGINLDWLKDNFRYFIIDSIECKVFAVCNITDENTSKERHNGYMFYERRDGWEFCEFTHGKQYINWMLSKTDRYVSTKDMDEATKSCKWN